LPGNPHQSSRRSRSLPARSSCCSATAPGEASARAADASNRAEGTPLPALAATLIRTLPFDPMPAVTLSRTAQDMPAKAYAWQAVLSVAPR
jgi:hypothetical protein